MAPFVDEVVIGGPDVTTVTTWLGELSSARQCLDLVGALLAGDDAARTAARRAAVARPGPSVDALAKLSALLADVAGGGPDLALVLLHKVADQVEFCALESDLRNEGEHP